MDGMRNTFEGMLSTIDSPTFSDVIVVYGLGDFFNNVYYNSMGCLDKEESVRATLHPVPPRRLLIRPGL